MSAALLGMAFSADMGTRSRKLVLLKLVDCCRDDGSKIFPSVASIAAAAQCAPRQVQRELVAMVDIGLLRVVKEGGRGRGSTTEYALDVMTLRTISLRGWSDAASLAAAHEVDAAAGDSGVDEGGEGDDAATENPATIKGDMASPLAAKGDTTDILRVTLPTVKGDASVTQPLKREPLEDPLDVERESARARISDREGDPAPLAVPDAALLDDLRKRHPASAHDDQWAVEAAWANLSAEERAEAVASFDAWLGGRKGRERILGLPKYLAQRSWRYLPAKAAEPTPKAAAAAAGKVLVTAFSRLMWWLVFQAFGRGDVRRARYLLELARSGTSGVVRDDERVPTADEEAAMAQLDRNSDAFRAWRKRVFDEHRIDLPIPSTAPFVFMPAPWPPRTGMAAVLEEDEEMAFGGGR